MDNSELDRRLGEVWERVSGKAAPRNAFSLPDDVRESNLETIKFIKENFSRAEAQWQELLAAKERTISDLSRQLDETRAHLSEMKSHYKATREKLITAEIQTALKLQETGKLVSDQKKNHRKETALLKEILEKSRAEIRELGEKAENLELRRKNLEKELEKEKEKHAGTRDTLLSLENKLDESKRAVEETLGELLSERRAHSETSRKEAVLEKRVGDLTAEIKNIRENWNAERKEWRELWERERSVWETHRHEFALWEEKLRRERELWAERIKKEEQKDIDYASRLSELLKETSSWSEKVTRILKLYALKGVELPKVFVSAPKKIERKEKKTLLRILAMSAAALVAFAGLGYWIHDYRSRAHFGLLSQHPLKLKQPTSVSASKEGLWISDWRAGISMRDKKDMAALRKLTETPLPFRPQDIDAAGNYVWALDIAQLRFVKLENKMGNIIDFIKTPGPAPQSMAFDGFNLWSFDASTGLLYRHSMDLAAGVESSYEIKGVKTAAKMVWKENELWILSGDYLKRCKFENGAFSKISSQKMKEKTVSFDIDGEHAWFLTEKERGKSFEIRKYRVKTYD